VSRGRTSVGSSLLKTHLELAATPFYNPQVVPYSPAGAKTA
jgi:hypothetical protein